MFMIIYKIVLIILSIVCSIVGLLEIRNPETATGGFGAIFLSIFFLAIALFIDRVYFLLNTFIYIF